MKIAVCEACKEVVAAGGWNSAILPIHVRDGVTHVVTIVDLSDDPKGSNEIPADYLSRLKGRISAWNVPLGDPPPPPPPATGFTQFTASVDTLTIYVSSSAGSDLNDGLSQGAPVATIAKGYSLLRSGFPDWLLLKRGDTWTNQTFVWGKSGRSATELMLVSTYGTGARPILKTGGTSGLNRKGGDQINYAHFAVVGLDIYNNVRDPASPDYNATAAEATGIRYVGQGENILFEDCVVRFFGLGFSLEKFDAPSLSNLKVRRNIIIDNYAVNQHSQGIFANSVSGLLVEENCFDHNGWHDTVTGGQRTLFNHNMYVQNNCSGVTIRRNISSRGASHGLQLRPGGLAERNFIVRNAIGMFADGLSADVLENVVYESDDISSGEKRGWGIDLKRNPTHGLYKRNIVVNRLSTNPVAGIFSTAVSSPSSPQCVLEANVIYSWLNASAKGIDIASSILSQFDVQVGNIVDGKNQLGQTVPMVDATRTLATYMTSIGLGGQGFTEWIAQARGRAIGTWPVNFSAENVVAYFLAGYTPS